jgi:hypothetical protein
MRIDSSAWAGQLAPRVSGSRGGASIAFALPAESQQTSRAASTAPMLALCDLQALIALQSFEEPKERRRKAVKRGFDLLDVLEGVKMDLLVGRVEVDRLERLVSMLGNKVETGDAQLDALMEEIELRARVELAKLGRYPD